MTEAEYNKFKATYTYQFSITDWDTVVPGDVRAQLLERAYDSLETGEPLAQIAYIGDRSKCQMDAKMATAYADAIDSVIAKEPGETWRCMLIDVSGDGYPLLSVAAMDIYMYTDLSRRGRCGQHSCCGWQSRDRGRRVGRAEKAAEGLKACRR